jgi:hypothetical protein
MLLGSNFRSGESRISSSVIDPAGAGDEKLNPGMAVGGRHEVDIVGIFAGERRERLD